MTTQALVQKESLSMQTARELGISDSRLQLVKDTFAKGATDDELTLFLVTAHRTGLDPMARQLFAVKRWDAGLKREVMSIQISIDGFRLIADRTNKYVPSREPSYVFDRQGILVSATAYIKKLAGGVWHEISATAFYTEYVQTTKEGNPNRMWQKMPRLMLAKCAESLVLRKAFPAELSGLYTPEEMGTDIVVAATTLNQVVNETVSVEDKLNQELADLCSELNAVGDSIKWSKVQLTEYAKNFFENEKLETFLQLSNENKNILTGDLTERLNELKAIASQDEPSAEAETIDAEIVEDEK